MMICLASLRVQLVSDKRLLGHQTCHESLGLCDAQHLAGAGRPGVSCSLHMSHVTAGGAITDRTSTKTTV